jgi:pilus assembly protein CpaC
VPVLGALFSSKSYQNNETDLVIIVTPHLVRPMRPGDPVKTPLDDTVPPNDADFFLLGKTELSRAQAKNWTPTAARLATAEQQPFTGHMIDMPRGVADASVQ